MSNGDRTNGRRAHILGQPRSRSGDEADSITEMILEAQGSHRERTIPKEDLDPQATTQMAPDVARVVNDSHVLDILRKFNRDYLYGLGRFDEYAGGVLLKWGDGYSRKHIWITVDGDNLVFETSHERVCSRPVCQGHHHVYPPQQWHDLSVINDELAEQFKYPIYETTED
ncbi:MAG: hypothetical protein ACHQ4H_13945 [Ktedonobacterales bacterium]